MMEQFMKLPPAQKAGVLAAILVVVGAGAYFVLIDPEMARANKALGDLRRVEGELAGLTSTASAKELKKLNKQKNELVEQDKENRKMLYVEEQLPNFIEQINLDARASGLRVSRFERLKQRQYSMVNAVPVQMVVRGSMIDFIKFLRMYASTKRRVIHLKKLKLEIVEPNIGMLGKELTESKPIEEQKRDLTTPEEWLLDAIGVHELARKRSKVKATFVAYVLTWTGKEPTDPTPPENDGKKKKRT